MLFKHITFCAFSKLFATVTEFPLHCYFFAAFPAVTLFIRFLCQSCPNDFVLYSFKESSILLSADVSYTTIEYVLLALPT